MTVKLLYLPGCPNHGAAANLVRSVLQAEGLSAELVETQLSTTSKLRHSASQGRRLFWLMGMI
jgi:hypothetical protein